MYVHVCIKVVINFQLSRLVFNKYNIDVSFQLRGMYMARQLSFAGVSFDIQDVKLSKEFTEMYDTAVKLVSEKQSHNMGHLGFSTNCWCLLQVSMHIYLIFLIKNGLLLWFNCLILHIQINCPYI